MKIALFGTGSFGMTMAIILARNALSGKNKLLTTKTQLSMYVRRRDLYDSLTTNRIHPDYPALKDIRIPDNLKFVNSMGRALAGATHCIFAIPSRFADGILQQIKPYFPPERRVLSLVKGFHLEEKHLRFSRISTLISHTLGVQPNHVASLGGPNVYTEIASNFHPNQPLYRPCNTVISSTSSDTALEFQRMFFSEGILRTYMSTDIVTSEISGALKNVYAIAAGAADEYAEGKGRGVNFKASLITRAAFEIGYFARALGGNADHVYGISGIGDLISTCSSGRNWKAGRLLERKLPIEQVEQEMLPNQLEGVQTVRVVNTFLKRLREINPNVRLEMPILEGIYRYVYEKLDFDQGAREIINRPMKMERRNDPFIDTEQLGEQEARATHTIRLSGAQGT
jgi:glycerol-3-phosphate dehydrogenase (NAD(P)+)